MPPPPGHIDMRKCARLRETQNQLNMTLLKGTSLYKRLAWFGLKGLLQVTKLKCQR